MSRSGDRKTIFITGGASGLGREVGRYFAEQGWFVGLADVNEESLAESAAQIADDQVATYRLDVTDRAQWAKALSDFGGDTGGRMDVLFNNAGIGTGGPIHDMTDAQIDALIAVNLTGVISGTRAGFEMLCDTPDSCILYTSSAAGIYGTAGVSVYSATKFAVRGLAEAHDVELRPYGIKSRSIMPGFIDTGIIGDVLKGSSVTGKQALEGAGIPVSPIDIIGPAAWQAVHGDAVHTRVNEMAENLWVLARDEPERLRKRPPLPEEFG